MCVGDDELSVFVSNNESKTSNTYELQCSYPEQSIQGSHTRSLEDGFYKTLKLAVVFMYNVLKVRER